MAEMQQQATATPAAAPPPPAQAAPGTPVAAPNVPTGTLDLSKFSLNELRRMRSELSSQRSDLASRRTATADAYEAGSGANKEGMGERLRLLDANIMVYENEMVRVGREIAARGGGVAEQPTGGIPPGYVSEDDAAGWAFGASFMTLLVAVFITRRVMRKRYAGLPPAARHQPNLLASNERLERIEQAVDSIAIEVERVSENQRFMTRLMTETQLGDTIKDVRKSTELAKSAAESSG